MSDPTQHDPPSARPGSRRTVVIGVVVAITVLVATGFGVAATPLACGSCHSVAPSHDGWQASAHSEVWCIECHSEPGAVGWAATIVGGAGELFTYVVHRPEPHELSAKIPAERCVRCHEDNWADANFVRWHPSPDAYCGACHRGSYHTNPRIVYPEIGPAAREVASGDPVTCAECHTDRQMLRADIMADPRDETAALIQGTGEG